MVVNSILASTFWFFISVWGGTKVHFRLGVNNGKFEHLLVHCPKLLNKILFVWGPMNSYVKPLRSKGRYMLSFFFSLHNSSFHL
jgi:hypothetical protein